ncbi:MAG: CCA tRNA nucleotidyltransferase [Gemmataceae bacterium]
MTEREFATGVVATLQRAGFQALWAGGCVRDELLGLAPADHDVATDARPEQVQKLFRRTHTFGASFGVVEVLGPRGPDGEWLKVQVATFRTDSTYSDGRRPDAVTFSTPEEDAKRRDFTINGLFFDPLTGTLIDHVGGRADLRAKVLRAIGDPAERFAEDKLRILRAVRMAARFGLAIDPATLDAARRMAHTITVVSAERIAEELRKMLAHPSRAVGVRLLDDAGLAPYILPELGSADWAFLGRVMERLPLRAGFVLAFAALLHELSAGTVAKDCQRLRLSNAEATSVTWLVARHADLAGAVTQPPSRLYPLLAHPEIADLFALRRAVLEATGHEVTDVDFCEQVLRTKTPAELNPPPLVTGDDLRALGLKPGPGFKRLLDATRAAQLDGQVRSKAEGLRLAEELSRGVGP